MAYELKYVWHSHHNLLPRKMWVQTPAPTVAWLSESHLFTSQVETRLGPGDIGLKFSFLDLPLSGFGIRVMLAS